VQVFRTKKNIISGYLLHYFLGAFFHLLALL